MTEQNTLTGDLSESAARVAGIEDWLSDEISEGLDGSPDVNDAMKYFFKTLVVTPSCPLVRSASRISIRPPSSIPKDGSQLRRRSKNAMFVNNARDAEPCVAADLSEIRLLVDRANIGINSVSLAHATVAPGAETLWHRLERTDEIYFILSGRGLVSVGDESREVGPGDTVWIPAGIPQRIRNLGLETLEFLCACGPAYVRECDQRVHAAALIDSRQ